MLIGRKGFVDKDTVSSAALETQAPVTVSPQITHDWVMRAL